MTVKFLDLQTQYQAIKQEVDAAVLDVLESSAYILGPQVKAFEEEFAAAHGAEHGVAVNSGTSALHLALLAGGVGAGDEVIAPSMTFTATAAAISYTGAKPVLVDCTADGFTLDPGLIERQITAKTKAIMPVHLYGQSADMGPIMEIAERHGLMVVEDSAQAHLASIDGRKVGGIGAMAGFSFYPGKNLGAYGEGGITLTNDAGLAEKLRLLRDWGQKEKYHHEMLAYNARMDGIQGAVLRVKLRYLEGWTEARRKIAARYQERIGDELGLSVSRELPGRRHVYHIFSVFHPDRESLRAHLASRDIATSYHYPVPVHLQKAYADLEFKPGDLPVTERIANQQLSLPIYPELPDDHVERVCDAVAEWCGAN